MGIVKGESEGGGDLRTKSCNRGGATGGGGVKGGGGGKSQFVHEPEMCSGKGK